MSKGKRISLDIATKLAKEVAQKINAISYIAGSIRRGEPEVGDIDIAVVTDNLQGVLDPMLVKVDGGDKKLNIFYKGTQVNLYACSNENLGAMMLFLTGPSGYGIGLRMKAKKAGLKLTQYGLFKDNKCLASKTEEDIYAAMGKNYKPPYERGR